MRSNKCVECFSFLKQHLQRQFKTFTSMFTCSLLLHCLCWRIAAYLVLVHEQQNRKLLINKQLRSSATGGQKLHKGPLNISTLMLP